MPSHRQRHVQFTRTLCTIALAVAALGAAQPGLAQTATPTGPVLGAASNFSQGWVPKTLKDAAAFGVTDYRDGMVWGRAEVAPGEYDFNKPRTGYAARIDATGGTATVVLNWGHRDYDSGDTPHSDAALAGLRAFSGALVSRFPNITSIEVGNEFNGINFVRGPIKEMSALERARAYVPMLQAAAQGARDARPGIRISGGASHSLPAAYLWEVLDAGAAEWLDSLAVHPYTTPAEHFTRQIEILRRHPAARTLPLEITEFGHTDPAVAPGHFLRNYCQFALGGVTRAVWYPLNRRGDGYVPLITPEGEVTSAGRTFTLIAAQMEGRPVADAAVDPFSYGCQFGEDVLVLWGSERAITVAPEVTVLDAEGQPVTGPVRLSESDPLVFIAPESANIATAVTLADSGVIADSFHQYTYPGDREFQAEGDAFERFARVGEQEFPLLTLPGQERRGTPWNPYRANDALGNIRLTAESLLPGRHNGQDVEIVHRFTVPSNMTANISAMFSPAPRSVDGISVTVRLNGADLVEASGKEPIPVDIPDLALEAGDRIEVTVGPNGSADGDLARYRITLSQSGG